MSGTGWAISLSILYLVLIFTLALLSFRKGHWVLGLIGFVFPVLWLIGAILPARHAACTCASVGHSTMSVRASMPRMYWAIAWSVVLHGTGS